MPQRQDDNYQYDEGTINDELTRYRLYDKGDDEWFQIIDERTGRAVEIKDGEVKSDKLGGVTIAREEDGDDIFDATNKALASAGSDITVFVEPGEYTRGNGKAVSTQLETTHEGQIVNFLGADVELADGADINPVHIIHDAATIENLAVDGNRANNTFSYAFFADGAQDLEFDNIQFSNTPIGINLFDVRGARLVDIGTNNSTADIDVGVRTEDSRESGIVESFIVGFTDYGMEFVDSEDLHLSASTITTNPAGQALATAGIHTVGTVQSQFDTSIESHGDISYGVYSEPYDPGGTDQQLSDDNIYNLKVEGAADIGVRLSDAIGSRLNGHILGEGGDPETTQGFLVDHPNALHDTPSHNIQLDVRKCTRVTDTQISSTNSGMQISGHYRQMTDTSTMQSNGTGVFTPTFGPAMPKPAFEILTNTSVNARIRAKRQQTDNSGQVTVDWSDRFAFDDKPIVMIQLENAGGWYVDTYNTDANGRYISALVQVTDPDGTAAASGENVLAMLNGA